MAQILDHHSHGKKNLTVKCHAEFLLNVCSRTLPTLSLSLYIYEHVLCWKFSIFLFFFSFHSHFALTAVIVRCHINTIQYKTYIFCFLSLSHSLSRRDVHGDTHFKDSKYQNEKQNKTREEKKTNCWPEDVLLHFSVYLQLPVTTLMRL